ncbi:MAG: hypothetical protein AAFP20_22380 [Cyanobacteria bacterium J06614_10]
MKIAVFRSLAWVAISLGLAISAEGASAAYLLESAIRDEPNIQRSSERVAQFPRSGGRLDRSDRSRRDDFDDWEDRREALEDHRENLEDRREDLERGDFEDRREDLEDRWEDFDDEREDRWEDREDFRDDRGGRADRDFDRFRRRNR